MQNLTSSFGSLALLGIVAAGFLIMFAPAAGKQILKNVAVATALFVLGSMLLSMCCSAVPP
jgi:hypothetical protein